jgi:lysophospholipase L1-like esterase
MDRRDLASPKGGLWVLLSPLAALGLSVLLVLSWSDVLPGGWRLHGLVEPHERAERREQARHSAERLRAFAAENPSVAPGSVVFIGSSTIERFPLEACFPGKPCVNRGIGNETAGELLRRLDASLPAAAPAGVVVLTGRADFLAGAEAEELARGVGRVLDALRERLPGTPLALIGLPPERGMAAGESGRLARANAALAALAHERGAAFVDSARPPIADASGALAEECSADRLHLNARGYRELARWIATEGGGVGRELAP